MTAHDGFERTVAVWLRDDALPASPDQLDALLVRTMATRQRRWWSSPERWLPMDTTLRPRLFSPPPIARLVVIAVVVIALAGLLLFAVGSRQPRLPAPFGPARNGIMLSSADGDIFAIESQPRFPGLPAVCLATVCKYCSSIRPPLKLQTDIVRKSSNA